VNFINEFEALNGNYTSYDSAPEMINKNHPFSNDLDVFGENSLFQRINRTVTIGGKRVLVQSFLYPDNNIEAIIKKQNAIKELELLSSFRDRFRVYGSIENLQCDNILKSYSLLRKNNKIQNTRLKYLPLISIFLFLMTLLLSSFDFIPDFSITIFLVIMININSYLFKNNNSKIINIDQFISQFGPYSTLINEIESQSFNSDLLNDLKKDILGHDVSKSISDFKYLCDNLKQSYNILGQTILNPILSWNVIYIIKIEKWILENHKLLISIFKTLSQFDYLISLSIFSFNNPDNTYPIITNEKIIKGTNIYHPFISTSAIVKNNINIIQRPFFYIITGGNMCGKSTYLRSIGINLLLSCMGLPVYAEFFKCYPFKLFTSINVSDSLSNNESYFFAELRRLKKIIEYLQNGYDLFVILDEILRGTNSIDKLNGSIAFIKRIVKLKACGLIASHDTELGKLKTNFPSVIDNFKFEAQILNEKLFFTYKLEEGVSINTNAYFLMRQMKIIPE
jgi:DNA mismatch repair ATPase MutS